jgi:arylesterase/paraoxonase
VSAPYIYDRLSTVATNRPGTFVPISNFKSYEIRFADKIRNCEDVILEESLGVAFLGCDPGRDRWNTVMVKFISHHQKPSMNLRLIMVTGNFCTCPFRP